MPSNTSKNVKGNLEKSLLNKNLLKRILTALPLAAFVIYAFITSAFLTQIVLWLGFGGALLEWAWIIKRHPSSIPKRLLWLIGGSAYIMLGSYSLLQLGTHSPSPLLPLFIVIWSADISAYFIGRLCQGPRLAPLISPGKTWSGAIGGLISAIVIGSSIVYLWPTNAYLLHPFSSLIFNTLYLSAIVIMSQIGDLVESYAKRRLNIKDSSQILPGHGGILDRIDSILGVGIFLMALKFWLS